MQHEIIERALRAALSTEIGMEDRPEIGPNDLSGMLGASELYQQAYDKAMAEYEALQAELRELERDHQSQKKRLKSQAGRKLALAREIAENAPPRTRVSDALTKKRSDICRK